MSDVPGVQRSEQSVSALAAWLVRGRSRAWVDARTCRLATPRCVAVEVAVKYAFYAYACCASEPWPVVLFTIDLDRSSAFYEGIVLVPGIVVTLLSFAVFWADTGSADALGYGINVIVVNLLSSIVLIDMLPVCSSSVLPVSVILAWLLPCLPR